MEELTQKTPENSSENVENTAEQIMEAENTLAENTAKLDSALEEFKSISPEAKTEHAGAWDKLQAVRADLAKKIEDSGHSVGEVHLLAVATLATAAAFAPAVAMATVAGAGIYSIAKTLEITKNVEA